MKEEQFNFELFEREAIAGLRSGKKLEGKERWCFGTSFKTLTRSRLVGK